MFFITRLALSNARDVSGKACREESLAGRRVQLTCGMFHGKGQTCWQREPDGLHGESEGTLDSFYEDGRQEPECEVSCGTRCFTSG